MSLQDLQIYIIKNTNIEVFKKIFLKIYNSFYLKCYELTETYFEFILDQSYLVLSNHPNYIVYILETQHAVHLI